MTLPPHGIVYFHVYGGIVRAEFTGGCRFSAATHQFEVIGSLQWENMDWHTDFWKLYGEVNEKAFPKALNDWFILPITLPGLSEDATVDLYTAFAWIRFQLPLFFPKLKSSFSPDAHSQ